MAQTEGLEAQRRVPIALGMKHCYDGGLSLYIYMSLFSLQTVEFSKAGAMSDPSSFPVPGTSQCS